MASAHKTQAAPSRRADREQWDTPVWDEVVAELGEPAPAPPADDERGTDRTSRSDS